MTGLHPLVNRLDMHTHHFGSLLNRDKFVAFNGNNSFEHNYLPFLENYNSFTEKSQQFYKSLLTQKGKYIIILHVTMRSKHHQVLSQRDAETFQALTEPDEKQIA